MEYHDSIHQTPVGASSHTSYSEKWRSYYDTRFGKDPDPQYANSVQAAGSDVCNMLKEVSKK